MSRWSVRSLRPTDRRATLEHLERDARLNLSLLELAGRLGEPTRGREPAPELIGAFRGDRLRAVASLRPHVMLDAAAGADALAALYPRLAHAGSGLIKSREERVAPLWTWLAGRGRHALLDRVEIAYALEPSGASALPAAGDRTVRAARPRDLDALVDAARASLRAERRPDAFHGDPVGFRRWVRSRIGRATVVECRGEVAFVGYADVRCARGWLLQGVYTWPRFRRRGLARVGVAEICRQAFASGADHVQLAVVEGNAPAEQLYRELGFRVFARLRTLLFS